MENSRYNIGRVIEDQVLIRPTPSLPEITNEEDREILKKIHKVYKKLGKCPLSVFKDLTIKDLIVKNNSELALLTNLRINAYNKELEVAKSLYGKVMRK
jgi:hypothetical protein